jgi:hypothetical protein
VGQDVIENRGSRFGDVDPRISEKDVCNTTALDGESAEDAGTGFVALKGDGRIYESTINDGCGCAAAADDGDGFAYEVDVFVVGAGGYEDGVASGGGVDAGLDGGLVGGDVDDGRAQRC